MYQFFIEKKLNENDRYHFNDKDEHHIKNVLRLSKGEIIRLVYNKENCYFAKIDYENKKAYCNVLNKDESKHEMSCNITLIQGIIKNDKFELILQKCTELGVNKIVPLISERVNINKDSIINKKDRWDKIILEAAKQCKREILPTIDETIKLSEISKYKSCINLFAYEKNFENNIIRYIEKNKDITIVIGCEGGFSEKEAQFLIDNGFISVSLGNRILRAETASIYSLSVISAINE